MPKKKQEKSTETKITKKVVKKVVAKESALKKKSVKKSVIKSVAKKKPVEKITPKKVTNKKSIKKIVAVKPKVEKLKEIWATGKRKTSIARVQFFSKGKGDIVINKKSVRKYFPLFELEQTVFAPLKLLKQENNFRFRIKVHGGGIRGQAEAVRLGISRALTLYNLDWRQDLKSAGYLRRDARKKERKKPGLKRARRAPQWAKR